VTDRILSQHGNVIAADFRPRLSIEITFKTDTLYQDDRVLLTRTTALLGGRPLCALHVMGDLTTGRIATF
jgi:hypothetical protein